MIVRLEESGVSRQNKILLSSLYLSIKPGEVMAIVGPNGAGKSTLLKLIGGSMMPTTGTVWLGDRNMADFSAMELAQHRAVLAQDCVTTARFPVQDMVAMGLTYTGKHLKRPKQNKLIENVLAQVGLAEFAQRDVTTLSGGERQRAHLARVLAQLQGSEAHYGPGLLLLDEPLAAQDLAHQKLIMDSALRHAAKGGSVVVVLHDLNWAAACADMVVVLSKGRLHAQGSPVEILNTRLLADVFGVQSRHYVMHEETGRPFIIPHDLMEQSSFTV
ncbi:heme ABC transporter ATP-binding protein [Acetobacter indonesiensis]|uniref:heme ABC transporter ATP-binding protein n=1 Tax=Acetobacter indonesiensis TaxID=104101 RepID=UPI001F0191CF|nr:heme ABC transporter ATP-binding protein [Acetobacter indonesiensis]MCG0995064.1 heme ABC transporter ATP-binding protein [Acetobacter indonesiensis]